MANKPTTIAAFMAERADPAKALSKEEKVVIAEIKAAAITDIPEFATLAELAAWRQKQTREISPQALTQATDKIVDATIGV